MIKHSIIIPVLNEEKYLPRLFENLKDFDEEIEVIVVDGGSKDDSVNIARNFNAKVYNGIKGRGGQLNLGAEKASGDIYIFLHADTILPQNAFSLINKKFTSNKTNVSTFSLKFDIDCPVMRFYEKFTKYDSIFTCFGDQVIITRRNFFNDIGGFPDYSIMEDVEFLRKARRKTKIYKLPASVVTSARKFEKQGKIKTQILNGWFIFQYLVGINPQKIYFKYFDK